MKKDLLIKSEKYPKVIMFVMIIHINQLPKNVLTLHHELGNNVFSILALFLVFLLEYLWMLLMENKLMLKKT